MTNLQMFHNYIILKKSILQHKFTYSQFVRAVIKRPSSQSDLPQQIIYRKPGDYAQLRRMSSLYPRIVTNTFTLKMQGELEGNRQLQSVKTDSYNVGDYSLPKLVSFKSHVTDKLQCDHILTYSL